ncbi:DUF6417 family protein [Streptomyces sp. NPDC014006]|uniref:DUF6417 family protein n=1 Tax=Streptomyces sp. NPDC014006 TaxID=3364870 RepID=UPI0036F8388F
MPFRDRAGVGPRALVPARRRHPAAVALHPLGDQTDLTHRALRRPNNRWRLALTPQQIDAVAHAFYLRALSGSGAEANGFGREYGVTYRVDPTTGRPGVVRLRWHTPRHRPARPPEVMAAASAAFPA